MTRQKTSPDSGFKAAAFGLMSELSVLLNLIEVGEVVEPCLKRGSHTELWETSKGELADSKSRLLDHLNCLQQLVQGPHEFFHDIISDNWDLGSLYTLIELNILEHIPLDERTSTFEIAQHVHIPERKLSNVLRLAACSNILEEVDDNVFQHTAFSEQLVKDDLFRAFVAFQLYETRIGSTNLADSLKSDLNSFEEGTSAFKYATGSPLYQWHTDHPDKGARFRRAMESVTTSLDSADALFEDWLDKNSTSIEKGVVVNILGAGNLNSQMLRSRYQHIEFLSMASLPEPLEIEGCLLAFSVRNVLWNKTDQEATNIIKHILALLKRSGARALLINEMLSPTRGEFSGALEHAYRRRDVTTMTMHNAKQRTKDEWTALFRQAEPEIQGYLPIAIEPFGNYASLKLARLGATAKRSNDEHI